MSKHRLDLSDYLRIDTAEPTPTSQVDRLECELLELYAALDHGYLVLNLLEKHRFWNRTEISHRSADVAEIERRIDGVQLTLDVVRALA